LRKNRLPLTPKPDEFDRPFTQQLTSIKGRISLEGSRLKPSFQHSELRETVPVEIVEG